MNPDLVFEKPKQKNKGSDEGMKMQQHIAPEILKTIPATLNVVDTEYNILAIGGNILRTSESPDKIIGKKCHKVFQKRDKPCPWCKIGQVIKTGEVVNEMTTPGDPREKITKTPLNIYVCPLKDKHGNIIGVLELATDITRIRKADEERKQAEDALQKIHEELELRVEKRTAQLVQSKKQLEEVNTALRVLLKQREEDKADLEEKVLSNVKDLVLPYVERLKRTSLGNNQMSFVDILESNLNDIIAPFSRKLSSKYLGLTPTEIRIANLIKEDKTTKEIAEFMNLSEKTVETHRDHIRKKIGIKHKKVNLRTYLLSM